jgi:hypothetical protein
MVILAAPATSADVATLTRVRAKYDHGTRARWSVVPSRHGNRKRSGRRRAAKVGERAPFTAET